MTQSKTLDTGSDGTEDRSAGVEGWPTSGPDFNRWNCDIGLFAAVVKKSPGMWLKDSPLKYLVVRIDTRSGCFLLFDTDHKPVSPDRVLEAAARAEADGSNDVYHRRSSSRPEAGTP